MRKHFLDQFSVVIEDDAGEKKKKRSRNYSDVAADGLVMLEIANFPVSMLEIVIQILIYAYGNVVIDTNTKSSVIFSYIYKIIK